VTYAKTEVDELKRRRAEPEPETIEGPDGTYTREDKAAEMLGISLLSLRHLCHKRRKGTNRHSGSHHLNGRRIRTIPGPEGRHPGPATKYCRNRDLQAILKSKRAKDSGEYVVRGVVHVDRRKAKQLGLDPHALDKAVDDGLIEKTVVISRRCGRRTTEVYVRKDVLQVIEKKEVAFDGVYDDGRINLDRAEKDSDIPSKRLHGYIEIGILPSVKQRPPRERGRCQDEHTVWPRDVAELKRALARGGRRPGFETAAEIYDRIGADLTTEEKVTYRLLLSHGRGDGIIDAYRPKVPISVGKTKQRPWLYHVQQALDYLLNRQVANDHVEERNGQAGRNGDTNGRAASSRRGPRAAAPPEPFVPSPFQERILKQLDGKALSARLLIAKLGTDSKALYRSGGRGGLHELMDHGLVRNNRRVGGYYRPDRPPPKYAEILGKNLDSENKTSD
jgi:hypothetical protein